MASFWCTLWHYIKDVAPSLALGFLLVGVIHEAVPSSFIQRHLRRRGVLSILYATFAGILLPLCCIGSLPFAVGLRHIGARIGPILSFLIATPATSITSILITLSLFGAKFTLYICLSVILMGIIAGVFGNMLFSTPSISLNHTCCICECMHAKKKIKERVFSILRFGFFDMTKRIGAQILLAILLAALINSILPLRGIITEYLSGVRSYFFSLIFGLLTYICSTATVPFVHALIVQGLAIGSGMVILLIGPITSYATLLVLHREFGTKVLLFYLLSICTLSLCFGVLFSFLTK